MDQLERIIRPIVEGQIKGFLKEHPKIVEAVDWYKPRDDKAITFINSMAKRIVRDLCCEHTRERVVEALLAYEPDKPSGSGTATGAHGDAGILAGSLENFG